MMIKEEYVKNHFIINPTWKSVFLANFPTWTPETYTESAIALFEKNGYSLKVSERMGNRPESKYWDLVRVSVTEPPSEKNEDGFICEYDWAWNGDGKNAIEQALIDLVCNYSIDFSKWQ